MNPIPLHHAWKYTDVDRAFWAEHLDGWLPHRIVDVACALFIYEDLRAIKQACAEIGIAGREETGMIFHANADRLIAGIMDWKQNAARREKL